MNDATSLADSIVDEILVERLDEVVGAKLSTFLLLGFVFILEVVISELDAILFLSKV